MKPARLVSASLVAVLALVTFSAAAAPKGAAPKGATPKTGSAAPKTASATPAKKIAKKAPKKLQPAPTPLPALQPLPPPVEPHVEVAESATTPPPAPTPAPARAATTTLTSAAVPAAPVKDAPASKTSNDPVEDRPISLAPLLGYSTNGLNAGVGLRAGYTLKSKIYLGASFVYQHGLSVDAGITSIRALAFYPSAEVGYELQAGAWTVRPYAGVGVFFTKLTSSSSSVTLPDLSSESIAVYPGLSALYNIPGTAGFIGGDARLLFAETRSIGAFVTGGVRF